MKYIKQFSFILLISFWGELLHVLLPFPVPASIYAMIILFICLQKRVIRPSQIKETAGFLIEIMPVLFIPAAVGLIRIWEMLLAVWIPFLAITVIATFAVIAAAGKFAQAAGHFGREREA